MPHLEVKNVSFSYDGKENTIEDINISLEQNELVCLLGVSGCGKSTLFNVISGLNKPKGGRVLLDGEEITGIPGKISYMLQKDLLLPYRTIEDNVALLDEPFCALDALTKSELHSWYLDVMERIKLSTLFITHDIDEAILLSDRIYLMSGKPGRITKEIVIEEKKPRSSEFTLTDKFLEYKRMIIHELKS